ncbi:MAG: methyltransferase domain-containing protein [Chitinophagia bacterium]|nr:methyltransferase domain-containing protein [Chitinophagia bacterium]
MKARLLLNLGCGPDAARTDWTDVDGSLNLLWQRRMPAWLMRTLQQRWGLHHWPAHVRYIDLARPLGFTSDSADAIYASHVLEHLHHDDALSLLAECRRVLKPGGVLRMVLPDLDSMVREYLSSEEPTAAIHLNKRLLFCPETRPRGLLRRLYAALNDMHSHKFMYDARCLTQLLASVGFHDIRNMACHESRIAEIGQVEKPGRIEGGEGFVVEAVKEDVHA